MVHSAVMPYLLGEIRLKSETIIQNTGVAKTAELLLQVAKEDVPTQVSSETDAMNRVFAFFVTLEFLGVSRFSKFTTKAGEANEVTGGALDYMAELEKRHRTTSSLQYLVLADMRMRQKVRDLCSEDPVSFPVFFVRAQGGHDGAPLHLERGQIRGIHQ